jgi:hypothetical protein
LLAFVVVSLMAVAGYALLPPWVVLFGVAGMADEGWWAKVQQLWRSPRAAWSTKVRAYFVTGLAANVALSAAAYAAGRVVRALIG